MRVSFCSTLPSTHLRSLERLVFFNRHQRSAERAIVQAVDLFGQPSIQRTIGGLHVTLASRNDTQCLFATTIRQGRSVLVGMALYARPNSAQLVVVHMAISGIVPAGSPTSYAVLRGLMQQIRAIATRVRGINSVQLLYSGRQVRSQYSADSLQRSLIGDAAFSYPLISTHDFGMNNCS